MADSVYFKDNREFFNAIEKLGLGVRIKDEVDTRDIGCLTRYVCEHKAAAPLFENIKGYPGKKAFGNALANMERLAVLVGIDPTLPYAEMVRELQDFITERTRPERYTKPKVVSDAPCKENVVKKDVNLYKVIPPVIVHGGDGAAKILTWHGIICKHPKTGWTNMGMYRGELVDENIVALYFSPAQDMAGIFREYEKVGKDMPTAVSIGASPADLFFAQMRVPSQVDEYDVIGGLTGRPLEVVKCETNDLLVPAYSEIVLEGRLLANKRLPEGPFGEYTGYRTAERAWRGIFEVDCVTYRNNPWLTLSNMGMAVDDCGVAWSLSLTASIRKKLDDEAIPYKYVYIPPEGNCLLIIIQAEPAFGIAARIAKNVFGISTIESYASTLIVVPPEYDPVDPWQILHAIGSRCNPSEHKVFTYQSFSSLLVPWLSPEQRRGGGDDTQKLILDAMWPKRWEPSEVPIVASWKNELLYSKELQEKTDKLAKKYGLNRGCEVGVRRDSSPGSVPSPRQPVPVYSGQGM